MTSVLACFVATLALSADPGLKGLPFGLPPGPDDAIISHVAPPQCLFYVNWAGAASPNASSGSETEKLLAEPEVQDFINSLSKVVIAALRKTDQDAKSATRSTPLTTSAGSPASQEASSSPVRLPPLGGDPNQKPILEAPAPGLKPDRAEKLPFKISANDIGDWLNVLVTHPTAIFVTDVKVDPSKSAEKQSGVTQIPPASASDMVGQAGVVVSLGSDATRLRAKCIKYYLKMKKSGADSDLEQITIGGQTWFRYTPPKTAGKNRVTFGIHDKYLVVGMGDGVVEGILARWNSPAPAWLNTAMARTQVPRRTGIVYLNLKLLRDKLLPLAPSRKDAVAALELLGLDNVDSLVSTTGLEDYGMINRMFLALDGKPRGLLDMAADRPLTAKDLAPIPGDALYAVAARVDLESTFNILATAYEKAGAAGDADAAKNLEELKKYYGPDVHRFLAALGDTWCVYNSPTEGEMAFLGWTAVVPIRDRAALLDNWPKVCAALEKNEVATSDSKPTDIRTCRFAGHEIQYLAGQAIAPAMCIMDRQVVMTLNMPAMKAYLTRKDHHSLAALPGVKLALSDVNRPVALSYCDAPKLFDCVYPFCSVCATAMAGVAHDAQIDLDPTFWPSAPAIRSHLRPDITALERKPNGLQVTYRYSLPTGGLSSLFWLGELSPGLYAAYTTSPVSQSTITAASRPAPSEGFLPATVIDSNNPSESSYSCPASAPPQGYGAASTTVAPAPQAQGYSCPSPYGTTATTAPVPYGYVGQSYRCPAPAAQGYTPSASSPYAATNPYGAAPVAPASGYANPYSSAPSPPYPTNYPNFNVGPHPAPGGLATNPAFGAAVTVSDVVTMSRAGVGDQLIINQIRCHGLTAPLRPADVISLNQQGISQNLIGAMQTVVADAELATPASSPK